MSEVVRRQGAHTVRWSAAALIAVATAALAVAATAAARARPALPVTVAPRVHARVSRRGARERTMDAASLAVSAGTTVGVGTEPTGVTATDSTAYVTNTGSGTLGIINLSTHAETSVPVGALPDAVALSADDSTAYVTNFQSGSLSIVNLSTDAVRTVEVGTDPDGVAVVGGSVYVSNLASGTISVVNPTAGAVTATIALPGTKPAPSGLAPSADSHTLYVDDARNGTTDAVDLTALPASIIGSVGVGTWPAYLAITGSTAYVANATQGAATPGSVSVLNLGHTPAPSVTSTIHVGSHPYGVAAVPRLGELLVSNSGDGTLDVVDTASGSILSTATVGTTPDAVAVTPDQQTAIVSNESDNTVTILQINTLARLWDQTSGAVTGGNTNSQNYESQYDGYDDRTADDFQVPSSTPSQGWRITGVFADGTYANSGAPAGPATSFNVEIYTNSPGTTATPGTLVFSDDGIAQIPNPASPGDVTLPLSPAPVLAPGTYWVSVQANENFAATGGWFWDDRAPQTVSPAVFEQPANKGLLGCTTWKVRYTCITADLTGPTTPDQAFALLGGIAPVSAPALSPAAAVDPAVSGDGGDVASTPADTATQSRVPAVTAPVTHHTTRRGHARKRPRRITGKHPRRIARNHPRRASRRHHPAARRKHHRRTR